jgi:hypothetical protein
MKTCALGSAAVIVRFLVCPCLQPVQLRDASAYRKPLCSYRGFELQINRNLSDKFIQVKGNRITRSSALRLLYSTLAQGKLGPLLLPLQTNSVALSPRANYTD